MGHPNFTQPASSPPPLGYPACCASAPCARRLPCREPLGCRFRNPCAPLSPGDSPRVVTAQRSLNARATVCWRLLGGGDRQNLQVNRWKEGHSAAVGWPNTLGRLTGLRRGITTSVGWLGCFTGLRTGIAASVGWPNTLRCSKGPRRGIAARVG